MKKYLIITSIILFISMVSFSIYNGSIYIEGVDGLTTNILVLHIELGILNYIIAFLINKLMHRSKQLHTK